jgi:TPR repeat protein
VQNAGAIDAQSEYELARFHESRGDYGRSLARIVAAADKGLPLAELHLGQIYQLSQQRYPLQQDVAAAVEYYRRAALGGTVPWTVPYSLGPRLRCSVNVDTSRLRTRAYGTVRVQSTVLYFHCTPRLTPIFLANASRWLHPISACAQTGSSDALVHLGACHQEGTHLERDTARAVRYFEQAVSPEQLLNDVVLSRAGMPPQHRTAALFTLGMIHLCVE